MHTIFNLTENQLYAPPEVLDGKEENQLYAPALKGVIDFFLTFRNRVKEVNQFNMICMKKYNPHNKLSIS